MSEELKQPKRKCPCCGQMSLPEIPELSQDVLDYYIACVMTGQPFVKTYLAYDGKIAIQVSSFNDDLAAKALQAVSFIDNTKLQLQVRQTAKYITYRLLVIPSINITSKNTSKTFNVQEMILKAIDTMLSCDQDCDKAAQQYIQTITSSKVCSGLPAKLLDQVTKHHTDLMNALIQRGFDQSFCKSIQFN